MFFAQRIVTRHHLCCKRVVRCRGWPQKSRAHGAHTTLTNCSINYDPPDTWINQLLRATNGRSNISIKLIKRLLTTHGRLHANRIRYLAYDHLKCSAARDLKKIRGLHSAPFLQHLEIGQTLHCYWCTLPGTRYVLWGIDYDNGRDA